MDISVVVPLFNEAESLPELCSWIERVMKENSFSYEVILVNDGSTDNSWSVVEQLHQENPNIKGIKFRRNYGKSAALNEGFIHSNGEVVITMDADLQDSPDEIPDLYKLIKEDNYHLISGWKKKRYDPIMKTGPTKLFNWATQKMSGIKLHDFNCGLKAYHTEVVKNIEVYGEMHRYIPVIAKNAGFNKIGEKVVIHRKRKFGTTKFGMERFINGLLDLLSIYFIGRFGKKPMHFFGTVGFGSFSLGFIIALYLTFQKIFNSEYGMTERPLFFLALICMIIGVQLFVGGFLGEMISRNAADRNVYQVSDKRGFE